MSGAVSIVGVGATTPIGLKAPETCAAIRAGLTAFRTAHCRDRARGPTLRAEVPLRPRPDDAPPFDRLVALVSVALHEGLASAVLDAGRCALILCTREPAAADAPADAGGRLLEAVCRLPGLDFGAHSIALPHGHAAAPLGVQHARRLLAEGRVAACLVAGVDSLHTPADRRVLGDAWRLKSDAVASGLIPGEGAACVALAPAGARGAYASILGVGLGREPEASSVVGRSPPTGLGLEQALRGALVDSGIGESRLGFRVSDMNGESYRAHESMLAAARVYRTRRAHFPLLLAAASVGETGAASGVLSLVVAAQALMRGHAPAAFGMCEASSERGLRGACLVGAAVGA